ncbi:MAG: molybdate ABC transporter substrate-binding protein [bacterium]|nr:molybdate ABC transporter substrate-binding protein [bacterium]
MILKSLRLLIMLFPVYLLLSCSQPSSPPKTVTVYCAAGFHKVAAEIGDAFEKKHAISVNYNFAGSNTLLSQLQLVKNGDVYIAASAYYLQIASKKGLVISYENICFHTPVLAVPSGNPKNISSLEDLGRNGVRVGMGNPETAAIGKVTMAILKKNKLAKSVLDNIVTCTATVNELVVFLGLGQVDAAVMWEDNVLNAAKINIIPIPENQNLITTIPAGLLSFSKKRKQAGLYIEFLLSHTGADILKKHGLIPYKKRTFQAAIDYAGKN